ncbi:MAG: carboxypeptidase-like regulatory domain-containing protein, partial [Paludibacteraceae bacterium]|nr:carboxypeptidase-like regulatory domain-containing protein [Paludibacteraceae bacterium]
MKSLKITLFVIASMLCGTLAAQQAVLTGQLRSEADHQPIAGANVTLANQNISAITDADGTFRLIYLEPITEEIIFSAGNFLSQVKVVSLNPGNNELGDVLLKPDIQNEMQQDVILQLSENELDDDEGRSQNMSSTSSTQGDVFTNLTSYTFSPVRFRVRGYEQEHENYYINGIHFNSQERGNFSFSSLGGLNDASRNKDAAFGIEANNFTYGGIGSSTNILMQASRFARGWKVGLAGSNRNYKARAVATYGTGLMENGWALAASIAYRFSPYVDVKGIIGEGIRYNSLGYFFSAEKKIDDRSTLSFVTFGSPTERGQNAAVTQEVYD